MITCLADQLKRDEGFRAHPYTDTVGKLTIGYGRNLTDVGISDLEAQALLATDIAMAESDLEAALPWTAGLDEVRRGCLLNMTFNMGVGGVCQFKEMLAACAAGDYSGASQQMLASKWAEQVGPRAQRLAIQMESGQWQ